MRRALALGLWALALLSACEGDPNDPQTWIKKLDEGALREKAVEELTRIYTDTLNSKNGNADDPAVKSLRDTIVPPLVAAFKQYRGDVGARVNAPSSPPALNAKTATPALLGRGRRRPAGGSSDRKRSRPAESRSGRPSAAGGCAGNRRAARPWGG